MKELEKINAVLERMLGHYESTPERLENAREVFLRGIRAFRFRLSPWSRFLEERSRSPHRTLEDQPLL